MRTRSIDALSGRFEAEALDDWNGIAITSIPWTHGHEANAEMHRRLAELLDEVEPAWSDYFVLVPYRDDPWFADAD